MRDRTGVRPDPIGACAAARRRGARWLPGGVSCLGVGRLVTAAVGTTLPAPERTQSAAFASSARNMRSQRDELSQFCTSLEQARAPTDLAGKSLAVVSASEEQQAVWNAAQEQMAMLSTSSAHRVVPATHPSLVLAKDDASYSVRAIVDIIQSVRTSSRSGNSL